jgi:HSP20 family molecular chaperone IbpA
MRSISRNRRVVRPLHKGCGLSRRGGQEVIAAGEWAPRFDIAETDKEFVIKPQIPEVKKEDVKVTVDSGKIREFNFDTCIFQMPVSI